MDAKEACQRDTSRDGFANKVEQFFLMNFAPVWALINKTTWFGNVANRVIIDRAVNKAPSRPHAFSSLSTIENRKVHQ